MRAGTEAIEKQPRAESGDDRPPPLDMPSLALLWPRRLRCMRDADEEGRRIVREKVEALAGLRWEELDAYQEQIDHVRTALGRRYRVKSYAYWDGRSWETELHVVAKAYAANGWRRFKPYWDRRSRGGPDDLIPPRPTPS